MKVTEFKAVHARTDLFAISPTPIDDEVPYHHKPSKSSSFGPSCPTGLVKAKVLQTGAKWTSFERFGCTPESSTHEVEHTNGILVEIDPRGLKLDSHRLFTAVSKSRATIVVSVKALVMPWSDYAPVAAARRKSQRESERRSERMAAALRGIGARHGSWHEQRKEGTREYVFGIERATVDWPMLHAETLGALLANLEHLEGDEVKAALFAFRRTIREAQQTADV